jgi:hypothetical protein
MIGYLDTIWLFHALAGLCAGWLWGADYGDLAGTGAAWGGGALGFTVGFLATRAPHEVNMAAARISRRLGLPGGFCTISGHLLWLGLTVAFWWSWGRVLFR